MRFLFAASLLPVLFLSALLGCTPAPSAGAVPSQYASADNPVILSERLDLKAPEGAGILKIRDSGRRTTAWFTMAAAVSALEHYFERQLAATGWLRETYRPAGNTAWREDFVREGERVTVYLELEDWSGRYRLEIR